MLGKTISVEVVVKKICSKVPIACWLMAISACGQTAAPVGQITGMVKDPAQAVVSGSLVVLTNQQTQNKITTLTDSQGAYSFPSLQPGAYVVEVDAAGFKPSISTQ